MTKKTQSPLPAQPLESKAQIAKAVKKALIQERDAGNLPSTCRLKIGWIPRAYATELHIIISGLDIQVFLPKLGADRKIVLSPENKIMKDAIRKVLKNNKIENFYIETRYGDASNTQEEE